jgi:hypothetical protein
LADFQFGTLFPCTQPHHEDTWCCSMHTFNVAGAALFTFKMSWELLYSYHEVRLKNTIQNYKFQSNIQMHTHLKAQRTDYYKHRVALFALEKKRKKFERF